MRVLLVSPEFPRTYWGFQYTLPLTGKEASLPPLGLVSLAALLPERWELRLVDLNIEPLRDADLDWADVVFSGGMLIQTSSILDTVARARARGKPTIVGGPGPTTSPSEFHTATHVFLGEAEERVETLVSAAESPGRLPHRLEGPPDRWPDISRAPVPRFDLLDMRRYVSMSVQYSRGCPYACEFCDIIELNGRYPRVKTDEQVLAELDALLRLGYRGSLFFVDDNFIGNKRAVKKLLPRLRHWQAAHDFPFQLYTEASVNLAFDDGLVRDMVEAGFSSVFLGIETPSVQALRESGKNQNLAGDLGRAVDRLTRAGLEVMGGFIVGFDSDGPEIFDVQRDFLASTPIPLAMVGALIALPGTALWRRLEREGRLRCSCQGDQFGRPNFEPAMGEEALLRGYAELMREIYSPETYYRRCEMQIDRGGAPGTPHPLTLDDVLTALRALVGIGLRGPNRHHFWRLLGRTLLRSPRALPRAIGHAIRGEHLIRYTHEDVLPRLRRALAEVRRERTAARKPTAGDAVRIDVPLGALRKPPEPRLRDSVVPPV